MPELTALRLEPVESPLILPAFVACYSAQLIAGHHSMNFAAGRACAAKAITALCGPDFPTDVGRGPQGEPLWPAGLTGSITHKEDFFWTAVARTTDTLSIGIDAERIIEPERATRIAGSIATEREQSVGGHAVDPAVRVSLLFSIKEAVFKCLYPLVQKRFYYDALVVTELDVEAGTFRSELVEKLSEQFQPGFVLTGRMQVDGGRAHAAIWLNALPGEGFA